MSTASCRPPALVDSTKNVCSQIPASPPFLRVRLSPLLRNLCASSPSIAQGTHLWTQSRIEEFEKGTPQGVAIGSNG